MIQPDTSLQERVAALLMFRLLEVVRESGADREEAKAALGAAAAMLTELNLPIKPTAVFR